MSKVKKVQKVGLPACDKKMIIVRQQDLPLSCPSDEMALWNAHPKVYLPIDKSGQEVCPYCGTLFIFQHD